MLIVTFGTTDEQFQTRFNLEIGNYKVDMVMETKLLYSSKTQSGADVIGNSEGSWMMIVETKLRN